MKTIFLVFLLSFLTLTMFSQKPGVVMSKKSGWTKIGDVKADFKVESESIVLLGNDKFKALKLKVKDAPINILALQVFYESGKTDIITVKTELRMNEETSSFSIEEKSLSKVVFIYKTLPNAGKDKAQVELYGLK